MENLTKKASKVLEMAANIAWTEKDREVQTGHLLCALAVVDGTAKEILKNNNIREEDMRQIYDSGPAEIRISAPLTTTIPAPPKFAFPNTSCSFPPLQG